MKKDKRIIALLLVLLMIVTMITACGGDDTEIKDVNEKVKTEKNIDADEESAADEASTDKKDTVDKKESDSRKNKTASTSEKSQSSNSETGSSQATVKTEPAVQYCYVTVSGYCSSKSIEVSSGMTVYNALKATGASVSAENTAYGIYVKGINGKFEFDEGPESGWVYTVNGVRASVSCGNYTVKSGDKIVWSYITSY